MPNTQDRPFINNLTSELAQKVEVAKALWETLPTIYAELMYREKKAAKKLRLELATVLAELGQPFDWPDTDATLGKEHLTQEVFVHASGLLGYLGYRVGLSGITEANRRDLLDFVYSANLPLVNSKRYMDEWGKPSSSKRLKKMAYALATFTKNQKKHDSSKYAQAIYDWESDLSYLKRKYYDSKFSFTWPSTAA